MSQAFTVTLGRRSWSITSSQQSRQEVIQEGQEIVPNRDRYVPSFGHLTVDLYTWEGRRSNDQPDILDIFIHHCLKEVSTHPRGLDDKQLEKMADALVLQAGDRLEELFKKQPDRVKNAIRRMATEEKIPIKDAKIQYVANDCIFRLYRDHYQLPTVENDDFIPCDSIYGFFALTRSGSIVSSPPWAGDPSLRTFYYKRMKSREERPKTGTRLGQLLNHVRYNHPITFFPSTGDHTFTTANVRFLLIVPPEKAGIFEQIRQGTEHALSVVQETIIRSHPSTPQKRSIRDRAKLLWSAFRSLF